MAIYNRIFIWAAIAETDRILRNSGKSSLASFVLDFDQAYFMGNEL